MTLPARARVIDVGPRDGFQMERQRLPLELKIETIDRLAASGVDAVEAVSFVHPKVIPQMADAAEVMAGISRRQGVDYLALVPNLKGAERALAAGVDGLRLVVCCTETYNQRNVGLSIAESLTLFGEIVRLAEPSGVPVSAVLSVAFGCPFEGDVPQERVIEMARAFLDAGSVELGVADSAGLAHPLQVRELLRRLEPVLGETEIWLHLHDTRGLGLANAFAALEEGVRSFDCSLGGLGGCPVMRGASGNISTEDFCYLCSEVGVETRVDLGGVRAASRRLEEFLERHLPSRVLAAGTRDELVERNRPGG